jgi:acetylornithine deacetylase/succinyl-diaminopimelate desuccinylase-like protein
VADALSDRVHRLIPQARDELAELVAFKSVADPKQFPPEDCERAAEWLIERLGDAGLEDLASYETPDGSKAVFGQRAPSDGAPTVLLYSHYDVQPPLGDDEWESPVWELTERSGRWYGRGAADCKGNIVAHLMALRALGEDLRVGVKFIAEGSEEQGTGGLERFVSANADLLRADAIVICDVGNIAVGIPTLTTSLRGVTTIRVSVETMAGGVHSGMFGGPAPDALAAMVQILSSLQDRRGNTTIAGLDNTQTWRGADYAVDRFRADAGVLDGVDLMGDGQVADLLWARPAVTILGIDCPPVVGSSGEIQSHVRARVSLRVPPGTSATQAHDALVDHLRSAAPWNVRVTFEDESFGEPFVGVTSGPGYEAMTAAMREAYGIEPTTQGLGGSIPLCNVLQVTYPDAEIMLIGVEEPLCRIHAPNESVDPSEIEHMALVEARFLQSYADGGPVR